MSRRPSIVVPQDEDFTVGQTGVASFSRTRDTPAVPQTPLVSQTDRELLDLPPPPPPDKDTDSSRSTGTKLPQKPQPRRASNAGAYKRGSMDWSRSDRSGSTFLPFGFFSSLTGGGGGDTKGRYEAVSPMAPRKYGDKTYVELNMDDYAEGLRLSAGDDDEDNSKMRRQSTGVGQFFDQFYPREIRRNRRTYERIILLGLAIVVLVLLLSGGKSGNGRPSMLEKAKMRGARRKNPLRSNIPLHSFRANLKDGAGYVTSFPYGGLTNQLIEMFKLVHVGQRLDRTVILTELKATQSEGGDVLPSEFFDLDSFAYYSNVSLVQWKDVKIPDITGTQPEELSCWGWRDERPLARYNVKTHFWPFPGQLQVPSSAETSITFPGIEVLASQDNTPWLKESATRLHGSRDNSPPFPDKQLLCFEDLFYVPSVKFVDGSLDKTYSIQELRPDGPVWDKVGRHLRFNSHVNHIADELLAALIGSRRKQYIGVHIAKGNSTGRISQETVDAFKAGVKQVQADLAKLKGGSKGHLPVLVATDSDDPVFLSKLAKLGWIYINHGEWATRARFGGWYPGVLDSVILSRAIGFVGTKESSFSSIAARRVETWNGGLSRVLQR
ncbi:hypothetical protein OF846_005074 [Rhodotorula toruloides]|nr:hypothetical protein OF846_005074 [Rhodotorula toruloides]